MNPTESQIQIALVEWWRWKYPDLADLLVKIPNEGKRSWAKGKQMKAEGIAKGFPDLFLYVPRGTFHGMGLEVKSLGKKPNPEQMMWQCTLTKTGYFLTWCDSVDSGIQAFEWYMNLKSIKLNYG